MYPLLGNIAFRAILVLNLSRRLDLNYFVFFPKYHEGKRDKVSVLD